MVRAIAVIAAAIGLVQPAMPAAQRAAYARTTRATAAKYDLDPLTLVAIGWHESGWRRSLISADGEDYGIMQVRARYQPGCRGKPYDSASCREARARLLDGHANIAAAGRIIHEWRKLCRKKTGRPALFRRWLSGYAGLSRPKLGVWCGQRKVQGRWRDLPITASVRAVIRCRRDLIRKRPCNRARRSSRRRSR